APSTRWSRASTPARSRCACAACRSTSARCATRPPRAPSRSATTWSRSTADRAAAWSGDELLGGLGQLDAPPLRRALARDPAGVEGDVHLAKQRRQLRLEPGGGER